MGRVVFVFFAVFMGGVLGAQDLSIDYRYKVNGPDAANYFTYKSAIRYIAADKDSYDVVSGASRHKSTSLFAPLQSDIMGKATISAGFRGLLLFPVAPPETREEDNLHVYREGKVIVMEYVHRGAAYRIQTDANGNITFPRGSYVMRVIGYIKGHDPQVISRDFSADMTAGTVDWKKVWDPAAPSGRAVAPGEDAKTGPIQNDYGDMMAMFNWDGTLQVGFEDSVLTIRGVLRPVKR